jgi:YidC/Oxa1 family membrane protein insertase
MRAGPLGVALFCAMGAAVAQVSAGEAPGGSVRLAAHRVELAIALEGAVPVEWLACHPSCARADAGSGASVRFAAASDPSPIRLIIRDLERNMGPPVDLQRLHFAAELGENERARIATFQADLPVPGVRFVKSFAVSRDGYEVVLAARVVGPNAAAFMAGRRLELEIDAGRALLPPPAAGFAAMLERTSRVIVAGGTVREVADDRRERVVRGAGDWAGFRSRFWAMLARSDGAGGLEPQPGGSAPLRLLDEGGRTAWRYTFYAGPLERGALTRADPVLGRLLYSGLWFWLRPLSFGLLFLLRGLTELVGHPGAAIIALAVSVKVLLLPLTVVAERLQEQVNATQARLQPGLDAIKAAYRGEERTRRTIALYREHGVHPLYTLKSLAGFMIQLPVFVAVFDMLAEDFDLQRVSFLWIGDLARPDALARLPACAPFFGCDLNLLPFMMSGVSLATLLRFRSSVLTPPLIRRQRRNLTLITVLFFLLFYTFPASMVLYWTSTNSFQLLSQELGRLWHRA